MAVIARPRRAEWARRYPALTGAAVAMVLTAFVLPSSLNTPQTNPSQTLEFAPVPPTDEDSPPVGNSSSLGLGSSGSVAADGFGGALELPPAPGTPEGSGTIPRQKRCVGNPPRQTEDPLSPPCVAYFEGDNFGATYTGVTRKEIRILFYIDAETHDGPTSRGNEPRPVDTYVDINSPESPNDQYQIRILRALQRYFNDRYQTYGRSVHFWAYFTRVTPNSPTNAEGRRADAAANFKRIQPFAVLAYPNRYLTDYVDEMARRGVLNFGAKQGLPARFYDRHPGRIWSFPPSIEQQAKVYSEFVCTKVLRHPTSFSGNNDLGKPRRLGLLTTTDAAQETMILFGQLAKKMITACGGKFVAEAHYPVVGSGGVTPNTGANNHSVASSNIATFIQQGVTTVIWPQGHELEHSKAAARAQYYPEWVLAGDNKLDGAFSAGLQDQTVWRHAWVISPKPYFDDIRNTSCYHAYMSVSPGSGTGDLDDPARSCNQQTYYSDLTMLFTGIQVAGPRLNPQTIDQGFHAIPAIRSRDPRVPACYYEPNDYTCIKDAAAGWWDSDARSDTSDSDGCWRYADGGQRYTARTWPHGDVLSMKRDDDPCNGFVGAL